MRVFAKSLYRNLLRLANAIPKTITGKGRDLNKATTTSIRNGFSMHANERDPQKIAKLEELAKYETESLYRLLTNANQENYPHRQVIVPAIVKKASILLSQENQEKIKKGKWSFYDRIRLIRQAHHEAEQKRQK